MIRSRKTGLNSLYTTSVQFLSICSRWRKKVRRFHLQIFDLANFVKTVVLYMRRKRRIYDHTGNALVELVSTGTFRFSLSTLTALICSPRLVKGKGCFISTAFFKPVRTGSSETIIFSFKTSFYRMKVFIPSIFMKS